MNHPTREEFIAQLKKDDLEWGTGLGTLLISMLKRAEKYAQAHQDEFLKSIEKAHFNMRYYGKAVYDEEDELLASTALIKYTIWQWAADEYDIQGWSRKGEENDDS